MSQMMLSSPYSADVQLRLITDNATVRLGQVGPDFAIVQDGATVKPGKGVLEILVDGERFAWNVFLPDGLGSDSKEFRFDITSD
jgi:hypothetical protein